MILPASYSNGFAPRDGSPLYPELWRGCVGAWSPCLGPTGLTLRDWSGRANNGTLTGMDAGTDWAMSGGRYALDFDGSNDHIPLSLTYSAEVTCSLWVYSRNITNANGEYFFARWEAVLLDFYVGAFSSGWIARTGNGSTGQSSLLSTPAQLNTWTHLCLTRTPSLLTLTVNGTTSVSTSSVGFQGSAVSNTFISRLSPSSGLYADALVDDIRVYSRAISSQENRLIASRRGIAYEMAARRRSSSAVQFNRRRRLLIGAGS